MTEQDRGKAAFATLMAQADVAVRSNRDSEALALLDAALALKPGDRDASNAKGGLLGKLGRFEDALGTFRAGLAVHPDAAELHYNAGFALQCLSRTEEALEEYDAALKPNPNFPEALNNKGLVLHDLRRYEEALKAFDEALRLRPNFARAYNNRGRSLADLRRFDDAIASYNRALSLDPAYPEAFNNRAGAYGEMGRFDDALRDYARATAIVPNYSDAHVNEAFTRLLREDFERGFEKYEWRKEGQFGSGPRPSDRPEWRGEDLSGKTILLVAEQGLGDTLQFCRYACVLAAAGANVVLEVQPGLRALLSTLRGSVQVIEIGDVRPAHDFHRALLSVPYVLKTRLAGIPSQIPYLSAEPQRVATWRARLADFGEGVKVGIAWQGSRDTKLDVGRSLPLSAFAALARVPNVQLVSLQKGPGTEQLDAVPAGMRVHVLGEDFDAGGGAFLDTAAVMESLDLVVASDTAVAHLAGAMGRPVWVPLKTIPDWRWMLSGEDSPWYPTMRLFRQRVWGEWSEPFAQMAAKLTALQDAHGRA